MIYLLLFLCPLILAALGGWMYYSFISRQVDSISGNDSSIDLQKLIVTLGSTDNVRDSVINEIDDQISNVLDKELMEKFPMIAGLVGKDYLDQLKPVFRDSIKEQFPAIMERIAEHAAGGKTDGSGAVDVSSGMSQVLTRVKRDLRNRTFLYFIILGAAIGGIEMLVFYLVS